jgi:anti-anti-sigma factor
VDATNYSSLRKALEGADGELCITTEGMLMYFTQSELETVFGNIRKLLLEFGGRWVTVDRELNNAANKTMSITMEGVPTDLAAKIAAIAAGAASKTTMYNNVFFDEDTDKVKKFVSDMGFDLEIVPMSNFMPKELTAFKDLPENIADKATEAIGETNFWVMTAKEGSGEDLTCEDDNFKANVELLGKTLHVTLAGRLDTITAPSLLALYREAESKGGYNDICIDMKELEYISSAGLRVLLIMRKALTDEGSFNLINMNDTVKEIIETTGFDTIFC